jgi:hypothetical protein
VCVRSLTQTPPMSKRMTFDCFGGAMSSMASRITSTWNSSVHIARPKPKVLRIHASSQTPGVNPARIWGTRTCVQVLAGSRLVGGESWNLGCPCKAQPAHSAKIHWAYLIAKWPTLVAHPGLCLRPPPLRAVGLQAEIPPTKISPWIFAFSRSPPTNAEIDQSPSQIRHNGKLNVIVIISRELPSKWSRRESMQDASEGNSEAQIADSGILNIRPSTSW